MVELEESLDKYQKLGLGVTAISSDSAAVLKTFADRVGGFRYPLLADPEAKIIRQFGVLNRNIPHTFRSYGICHPGTFIVDENGVVQSKFFEENHRQRTTAETILVKEYGAGGIKRMEAKTEHLKFSASVSQSVVRPGNRFAVIIDVDLKKAMHVYAPDVENYRPIRLTFEKHKQLYFHKTEFPNPIKLRLEAIKETVPVYKDRVRVTQDVTLSHRYRDKSITLSGKFEYQACDDKTCYVPASVPVTVTVEVVRHDSKRVPPELRKKRAIVEVYELRTYTTNEGKLENLNARFRDHTLALFKKHGMQSVGYWVPTDERKSKNTLIYVLKHKSRDAAKASWAAFRADPQWQKVTRESQKHGRILAKPPESVFMHTANYSPMLSNDEKSDDTVFELRTYRTNKGKLTILDARFRDHGIRIFNRFGIQSVAYWHPADEPDSRDTLIYVLRHDSRDVAKASWKSFAADEEWKKITKQSEKDGKFLRESPESIYMRATDYSPIR